MYPPLSLTYSFQNIVITSTYILFKIQTMEHTSDTVVVCELRGARCWVKTFFHIFIFICLFFRLLVRFSAVGSSSAYLTFVIDRTSYLSMDSFVFTIIIIIIIMFVAAYTNELFSFICNWIVQTWIRCTNLHSFSLRQMIDQICNTMAKNYHCLQFYKNVSHFHNYFGFSIHLHAFVL